MRHQCFFNKNCQGSVPVYRFFPLRLITNRQSAYNTDYTLWYSSGLYRKPFYVQQKTGQNSVALPQNRNRDDGSPFAYAIKGQKAMGRSTEQRRKGKRPKGFCLSNPDNGERINFAHKNYIGFGLKKTLFVQKQGKSIYSFFLKKTFLPVFFKKVLGAAKRSNLVFSCGVFRVSTFWFFCTA